MLTPAALIWMCIIPCIILLYFLKLKRNPHIFPSTILWRKTLQDMQVNAPFQRLKSSILLFLQILVVLVLVMALARPFLSKTSQKNRHVLLLLDNSASMQTLEGEKTRFQLAIQEADKIIVDLGENDRLMLASFGANIYTHTTLEDSQNILRAALAEIRPRHEVNELEQVLVFADTITNRLANPHIYIITDGRIPNFTKILQAFYQDEKNIPKFILVGKNSSNVAIISFEAKRLHTGDTIQAFARVHNTGTEAVEGLLQIRADDITLETETKIFKLQPGDVQGIVWSSLPGEFSHLEVHFHATTENDFLELDNHAHYVLGNPHRIKVLLSSTNRFLHKVLATQNIDLKQVSAENITREVQKEEYDLVVLDNWIGTEILPPGSYLCFHSMPIIPGLNRIGEIKAEQGKRLLIQDQKDDHELFQFTELRKLNISKMWDVHWPSNTIVMLEIEKRTAIGYFSYGPSQYIVTAFDLWDSDWPLEISFPVFVQNAIIWSQERKNFHQTVGKPFFLPIHSYAHDVKILRPDQREVFLTPPPDGIWTFAENDLAGIYQVTFQPDNTKIVLSSQVNSLEESTIEPVSQVALHGEEISKQTEEILNQELWPFLTMIGIFLLLLEWYFFHKRSLSIWQFLPKKKLSN